MQCPAEAHTQHEWGREHERLAEHDGLGLDAADPPAEHAQPVDHGRVRVGSDERVGDRDVAVLAGPHGHYRRQVLEVDLMHDAHARRHDAEGPEGALGPAQQLVALGVALVLAVDVAAVRGVAAEGIDLHRVVDDEVAGHERVDSLGVDARARDRRAHRGEVDDGGHTREVLQHDAGRRERNRGAGGGLGPARERLDVGLLHVQAAGRPKQALEQDPDGVGEGRDVRDPELCEAVEPVDVGCAV